jgi:hypothetical protein
MSLKAFFETDGITLDFGILAVGAQLVKHPYGYRTATKDRTLLLGLLGLELKNRAFLVLPVFSIGGIRSFVPVPTRAVCLEATEGTFCTYIANHFFVHDNTS